MNCRWIHNVHSIAADTLVKMLTNFSWISIIDHRNEMTISKLEIWKTNKYYNGGIKKEKFDDDGDAGADRSCNRTQNKIRLMKSEQHLSAAIWWQGSSNRALEWIVDVQANRAQPSENRQALVLVSALVSALVIVVFYLTTDQRHTGYISCSDINTWYDKINPT